jgi:hypothetical protein
MPAWLAVALLYAGACTTGVEFVQTQGKVGHFIAHTAKKVHRHTTAPIGHGVKVAAQKMKGQ